MATMPTPYGPLAILPFGVRWGLGFGGQKAVRISWRWAFAVFGVTVLIAPALGMRWSPAVRWGFEDFVAAGSMLVLTWLAFEGVLQLFEGRAARTIGITVVSAAAIAAWALLAVQL